MSEQAKSGRGLALLAAVGEAYDAAGLTLEAKRIKTALGAADSKNKKRAKLIAKLRKNPSVRDPEALASWIGLKIGGQRSHD